MDGAFDVVILGTGLTESILAAALSQASYRILHLDTNAYYGSHHASLSLPELTQHLHTQTDIPSRGYSISLTPSLIPARGPLINALIQSGVAKYGGFGLLERMGVVNNSNGLKITSVPTSKESIFSSTELGLIQKRRLMRFLMFAAQPDFATKLNGKEGMSFAEYLASEWKFKTPEDDAIRNAILWALAFCDSENEETLPALTRINTVLHSTNRYGPSPFIVAHYGGLGEISQGFCRSAAVAGGMYVLGRNVSSFTPEENGYKLTLDEFPDEITCDVVVAAQDFSSLVGSSAKEGVAQFSIARCIAIIDRPIRFRAEADVVQPEEGQEDTEEQEKLEEEKLDTTLLVFPPGVLKEDGINCPVTAFITGERCMSAPAGRWIVYASTPTTSEEKDAEKLLRPYLDAVLKLADADVKELFSTFYLQHSPTVTTTTMTPRPSLIMTPIQIPRLADTPDNCARDAEKVFWDAVKCLKARKSSALGRAGADNFKDATEGVKDTLGTEVEGFWPPGAGAPEEDDEDEF